MTGVAVSTGGIGAAPGSNRSAGSSCGPGTDLVGIFCTGGMISLGGSSLDIGALSVSSLTGASSGKLPFEQLSRNAWFKTASLERHVGRCRLRLCVCGVVVRRRRRCPPRLVGGQQNIVAWRDLGGRRLGKPRPLSGSGAASKGSVGAISAAGTGAPCPLSGSGTASTGSLRIGKRRQRRREFRDGLREVSPSFVASPKYPAPGRGIDICCATDSLACGDEYCRDCCDGETATGLLSGLVRRRLEAMAGADARAGGLSCAARSGDAAAKRSAFLTPVAGPEPAAKTTLRKGR